MGMSSHVKQNLKSAQLVLETLKRDHEHALSALHTISSTDTNSFHTNTTVDPSTTARTTSKPLFNEEKVPIIESALLRIQNGLDDSDLLFTFAKYVDLLEAENGKLNLYNVRLREETEWLQEELKHTQVKLKESESRLVRAQMENRQLQFSLDLARYSIHPVEKKKLSVGKDDASSVPVASTNECVVTGQPRMAASSYIDSSPSFPRHMSTSCIPASGYEPARFRSTDLNSLTNSQLLDVSTFNDGDLSTLNCTQSYHLNFIGDPNERRTSTTSSSSTQFSPRLRALHRLVTQYTTHGKHDMAVSLCTKAIKDIENCTGGRDQPDVAVLLNMLALVYRDQGKHGEAADVLQEVVAIRERVLGPHHPLVAAALNNLAVLYAKTSRYADAEPLCRRALAIREKLHGPDHPDIAKQLNNLALLCQNQHRFEEVEVNFRKALDIYLKHHRSSSPIVLRAKNNLVSTLLKRGGNLSEAEFLLKQVLTPTNTTSALNSSRPKPPLQASSSEFDSAVFCFSSIGSSYTPATADTSISTTSTVVPVWILAQQQASTANDGRIPVKFDLASWAYEARIELSIVVNALRHLAMVYQRQGYPALASLLRVWIQPFYGNGHSNTQAPPVALGRPNVPNECTAMPSSYTCMKSCSGHIYQ